jgi:hypothetical protein
LERRHQVREVAHVGRSGTVDTTTQLGEGHHLSSSISSDLRKLPVLT